MGVLVHATRSQFYTTETPREKTNFLRSRMSLDPNRLLVNYGAKILAARPPVIKLTALKWKRFSLWTSSSWDELATVTREQRWIEKCLFKNRQKTLKHSGHFSRGIMLSSPSWSLAEASTLKFHTAFALLCKIENPSLLVKKAAKAYSFWFFWLIVRCLQCHGDVKCSCNVFIWVISFVHDRFTIKVARLNISLSTNAY